jgi:hypothetical protein
MLDCITICRKPSKGESSKATEQQLARKHTISSVATASVPPPGGGGGTSLMICSNTKTWHSTQQVLQYLENLKDVEADQQGNRSSFTASSF